MPDSIYALLQQAWATAATGDANVFGVEVAIVTNVKDPDQQGRVKICFPRMPGKPESDWARVAQPSAGDGRGFYWLPEVNDEVLVAFERGEAHKPYVIGAVWNGKDAPMKDAYSDENTTRLIQTRSGHRLLFDDKAGEERIVIADKSGKRTLTFDVKAKKLLIEAGAGSVEIRAGGRLVLDCHDLEIKTGKTGKLEIGTSFDLHVEQKASLKSGPSFDLKADRIEINPSASFGALLAALAWQAAKAAVAAAGSAGGKEAAGGKAGGAGGGAGAGGAVAPVPTKDVAIAATPGADGAGPGASAGGAGEGSGSPGPGGATGGAGAGTGDAGGGTGGAVAGSADASGPGGVASGPGAEADPGGSAATTEGALPGGAGTSGGEATPGPGTGAPPAPGEDGVALVAAEAKAVDPSGRARKALAWVLTLPDGKRRLGSTGEDGALRVEGVAQGAACTLDFPDVPQDCDPAAATAGAIPFRKGGVPLAAGTPATVVVPLVVRRGRLRSLLFETDKTFLLPSAMTGIRQLKRLYESYSHLAVVITGHASKKSTPEHNLALSRERARSIKAFLQEDSATWVASYGPQPVVQGWGVREDQHMLRTLKDESGAPFYDKEVDGDAGSGTQAGYARFRAASGLPPDPGGADLGTTRRRLVERYLALEGTTLPPDAQVQTHGCGSNHPAVESADPDEPKNRRVEVFLFEGEATPPATDDDGPEAPCPEYPEWVKQSTLTVDLDDPPGAIDVRVRDPAGAPLAGASVRLSGPLSLTGVTDAAGVAPFRDLIAGDYRVIASKDGFDATDDALTVSAGSAS